MPDGLTPDLEIVSETHTWSSEFVDRAAIDCGRWAAARREQICVDVARSYLPRPLRWMVGRPRLLRIAYALRPSWRPTIYVGVDGEFTVFSARAKDGTLMYFEGSTAREESA